MRREFLDPANKYKAQYRELEERMRERKRRHEETDKLQDEVKKYKEKNDARLPTVRCLALPSCRLNLTPPCIG